MKLALGLSGSLIASFFAARATAAPPNPDAKHAEPAPKPTLVAQAPSAAMQPASDTTGSVGGSSATAAAPPAATAGPSSGAPNAPTASSNSSTQDAPQAASPQAQTEAAPRPFAGTSVMINHGMTLGTIFRGQQQDYNPTVEGSLWLLPRYAINKDFQLRARAIVNYEYTNSDSTVSRNEPMLSDTTLSLFYRSIPEIATIKPSIGVNVAAPTSKLSRARTLIFSPSATFQLSKGIEHFLGGDASIIAATTYTHPIYSSPNPEVVDARPSGAFQCAGGNTCSDLLSGTMNPSDSLSYSLTFAPSWGKWSPAIYYMGTTQWAYHPREIRANEVQADLRNEPITSGQPNGPRQVRQTHYFSAWLDYNFTSWMTGELGYTMSRNILDADGSYGNPFFNRYQDTRVYLSFSFQIDNIVQKLSGSEGQGGIVRATNDRRPFGVF